MTRLAGIVEALLLAADGPLSLDALLKLIGADLSVGRSELRAALAEIDQRHAAGACELREVAGGFRLQVRQAFAPWVARLWQDKPPRYSRAALETLALIVYRQPITRGEIEDVRGVAVSPNILRALIERGWVHEVGVRETPGRPALFGTTRQFLDDFDLQDLDALPSLPEVKQLDQLEAALARLGVAVETAAPDAAVENEVTTSPPGDADPAATPQAEAAVAGDAVSPARLH
ncbi:MAG: SMC-Scp complex subunit ScpB [Gammaproteobacteria bacterium]|nr:SMC-Scp complex subunit ScpB [Gammaproteobacteria bacterium]